MKKRLLAVLLACCMAAGMANAVFAADELPATAESAAAIAPADPDPPAPEPEMEAEPTPAADPAATPETARTLVMETLLAAPDTAAQTAVVTSVELVDSIRTDGCFTAKVNGSTDRLDGAVYTWYRSKDGTNWEEVPQQLCSGDAWNITPGSEHRLNAALDACIAGVRDAERLYYKVEVTGTDGAKLTAAAMQVPYCIQLQNGSFETPDIAGLKAYHNKNNNTPASRLYYSPDGGTGTFFTQYPSGEGGIVWQTTGVARHWQTGNAGLYIELADGSNRSYNGTRNYPEASYSIDGEFYTSAQATIDYIRVHHPECKRLFLLGTPSMIKEFEEAGFESTDDNADDEPDAVVVSFDMSLVYSRLCRAAWWINQKKLYIATNPDRVCPTDKPLVLVDCGSICSSLEYATGREPDVVIGKPDPRMLNGIMERHNLRADQVAMVGDRIYTDILMAQKANALGVLVLSGETTYETAIAVHPNPDLILRDLAELQQMLLLAHEID